METNDPKDNLSKTDTKTYLQVHKIQCLKNISNYNERKHACINANKYREL